MMRILTGFRITILCFLTFFASISVAVDDITTATPNAVVDSANAPIDFGNTAPATTTTTSTTTTQPTNPVAATTNTPSVAPAAAEPPGFVFTPPTDVPVDQSTTELPTTTPIDANTTTTTTTTIAPATVTPEAATTTTTTTVTTIPQTVISPNKPPVKRHSSSWYSSKSGTPWYSSKCGTPWYSFKGPWNFTIAPYVWGMNMNGLVKIGNRGAKVNQSFSDILSDFKGGAMLWLEANNDRWGIFLNSLWAYLDRNVPIGTVTLQPVVKFGLFTAGASYQIYNKTFRNCTTLAVQPYLGARYTVNNVQLKVLGTSIAPKVEENWVDPIIGARFNYGLNKNWVTVAAADIGGTGGNQKSYNLNAYLGYKPTNKCVNLTLYGGYRLLYQKYIHDNFTWKMHLFGPVIGAAFTF